MNIDEKKRQKLIGRRVIVMKLRDRPPTIRVAGVVEGWKANTLVLRGHADRRTVKTRSGFLKILGGADRHYIPVSRIKSIKYEWLRLRASPARNGRSAWTWMIPPL